MSTRRIHLVHTSAAAAKQEMPEYSELLNALLEAWQPESLTERQLVTDMAEAKFGMWRMAALEMQLWNRAMQAGDNNAATGIGAELDAIGRSTARYEKRYQRALSQLLDLAANMRPAPPLPPAGYGQSRRRPNLMIVARGRGKGDLPKAA